MRAPAFQFYTKDWLGSRRVSMMPLEAEGAYIRLLCHCWNYGSVPACPKALANLIGKQCSTTLAKMVADMFEPSTEMDGELVHPRMEAEREKQRAWREKSAKGGRNKGNQKQSGKGGSSKHTRVVEECLDISSNNSATLQSASASAKDADVDVAGKKEKRERKPKSAEDAEAYARSIGCSPGQGDAWFDKMEGNGWLNGGKPVADWRGVIRAWHKQGYMPEVVNYTHSVNCVPDQDNGDQMPLFAIPQSAQKLVSRMFAKARGEELPPEEIEYLDQPID